MGEKFAITVYKTNSEGEENILEQEVVFTESCAKSEIGRIIAIDIRNEKFSLDN